MAAWLAGRLPVWVPGRVAGRLAAWLFGPETPNKCVFGLRKTLLCLWIRVLLVVPAFRHGTPPLSRALVAKICKHLGWLNPRIVRSVTKGTLATTSQTKATCGDAFQLHGMLQEIIAKI